MISRREFKRIAFESLVRLERKAERESRGTAVSLEMGWKCHCGFECSGNDEFYDHLASHETESRETQEQLRMFK